MVRLAWLEYIAVLDGFVTEEDRADELEIQVRNRATDGGRFDEILSGRAGLTLEALPAWARHEVGRCQRYASLLARGTEDRARYLVETAESILAAWARAGDLAWVLDRVTSTWRRGDQVVEQRAFSVEDQFVVVVEAVERAPGVGHLVRTRGLAKFARAEVGMRTPRSEAEAVSEWVREVGRRGAEGEVFQPGRRLLVAGRPFALWPRSEDCLETLPPNEAPLFELREGGLAVVR